MSHPTKMVAWLLVNLLRNGKIRFCRMVQLHRPLLLCLLVFLAVARPVLGIDYTRLSSVIRSYAQQTQLTEAELTETKNSLTESIIAQETAAYIQDKTETLGLDCRAEVAWTWSEEGLPVPTRVTVTGTLTEGERSLLTDSLTQDLGLSPEQIVYADEEEP